MLSSGTKHVMTLRHKPTCARLAALAAALLVLCAAPVARAAAPICDELAQTIAAPPPNVPLKPGTILPLVCPEGATPFVGSAPPPEPLRQLTPPDAPERMLAFGQSFPPLPRHHLVPVTYAPNGERPGHYSALYRPPRA